MGPRYQLFSELMQEMMGKSTLSSLTVSWFLVAERKERKAWPKGHNEAAGGGLCPVRRAVRQWDAGCWLQGMSPLLVSQDLYKSCCRPKEWGG